MALREITYCEICDNPDLTSVMDLGQLPLPDELVTFGDARQVPKYPTEILFCDICKTAHQRWVVPNKVVFPLDYHYRGANTKDVLSGMETLVDAVEKHGLVKGLEVLDVGCNDGSLLDAFARRGAVTYGIEPTDAAQEAAAKGHCIEQVYLNPVQAQHYINRHGHPDIITFVNVFAHIENFPQLLEALRILKGPETHIIIENHYLGSVLERNQFDTFYHEHPRTYSCTSFAYIASLLDMNIGRVEFPSRYGGNIRVHLYPGKRAVAGDYFVSEKDFQDRLFGLARQVGEWKYNKRSHLRQTGIIPAVAMPGRATILFNILGLDAWDISGVYEVPRSKKIGHYVPGTRIPILSETSFNVLAYDGPVLNMAWHIPDEIETHWRELGFKGQFIQAIDPADFT